MPTHGTRLCASSHSVAGNNTFASLTRDVAEAAATLCNSSYIRFGEITALSCAPGAQLKKAKLRTLKGGEVIKLPRQGKKRKKKTKKKEGLDAGKGLSLLCLSLRKPYKGTRGETPCLVACVQSKESGLVTVGELATGCVVRKGAEARLSASGI